MGMINHVMVWQCRSGILLKLQDGTIFEKMGYEGEEPFQFVVNEEQVVAGLDKAVETMKTGEIALITMEPEYGFGNIETQRDLAVIPPNSILIYEVEMVSFTKEKELWDMVTTEKIEANKRNRELSFTGFISDRCWKSRWENYNCLKKVQEVLVWDWQNFLPVIKSRI